MHFALKALRVVPAALVIGVATEARADVSSWLFMGGGASSVESTSLARTTVPAFLLDAGMGTSPANILSIGGLFRLDKQFTQGSSYQLLARGATRGYDQGTFGLALDLGGYLKSWGDKKPGLAGGLSLGAPWGATLNLCAQAGPDGYRAYAAVLGVDFARLTVYRSMGENWWPNPFPSPRAEHVE